jgi:hypothetical protein
MTNGVYISPSVARWSLPGINAETGHPSQMIFDSTLAGSLSVLASFTFTVPSSGAHTVYYGYTFPRPPAFFCIFNYTNVSGNFGNANESTSGGYPGNVYTFAYNAAFIYARTGGTTVTFTNYADRFVCTQTKDGNVGQIDGTVLLLPLRYS